MANMAAFLSIYNHNLREDVMDYQFGWDLASGHDWESEYEWVFGRSEWTPEEISLMTKPTEPLIINQLTLFEPAKPTDMYQVQQDIREKAGITKSPECHDEVSLDEWRRRVGKTFDSYRIR